MLAVLATDEPVQKPVLSKEEIEEHELKERKLKEKEKLEQALKLRETEEAAENTGMTMTMNGMAVYLKKGNF